ncbi:MAG: ABC transporter permease [Desulfobacterales bacterium]|nr:ABC transporter permease [Desulfobacterales bacterium]
MTNRFELLTRQSRNVLVTVAAVFFFTSLVLMIAGAPPLAAYYHIFKGSLGSWIKFSHVIKSWIPLTLCACGLLFTFRIGLWNIGIEGQVMMGAVFTTAVLRLGLESQMPSIIILGSIIAGLIGGALWALIAGFLKTKGGVNEIFAGLGLNFVAQGVILWLIFGPWKRPGVASMSGTEVFPPALWLPQLASLRLSLPALGIVCLALILTALILRYTKIGLHLKAIGSNSSAAYLFGLKPARNMVLAMIFAGGFAGVAGSLQVSGVYHRLLPAISSNYGYLALLVAMLSNYNIWLVPLVALFFACLNVGSIQLPMALQLDSSLSGVIQGALVLAALGIHGWRRARNRGQKSEDRKQKTRLRSSELRRSKQRSEDKAE